MQNDVRAHSWERNQHGRHRGQSLSGTVDKFNNLNTFDLFSEHTACVDDAIPACVSPATSPPPSLARCDPISVATRRDELSPQPCRRLPGRAWYRLTGRKTGAIKDEHGKAR